ncbi:MAG: phenylacetate-CoA oxygenase subunit PaaC [Bacillus sp. (in: Bacteria)]|nr:phenylacetate-CoA oxygenase subunit PaaC [Bacillus sp. (in: firmicutes)]
MSKQSFQNIVHKQALIELLYQLADDDFLLSFRGSEWLGLCPHIEEDVAYSSITQNTMGHAAMYYKLLEELGEGTADALAHEREAESRKNAIILEKANGKGFYTEEPVYDWAFAVVRNYFYEAAKKVRLDSLKQSSYVPLANVARSISREQYYHFRHWEVWFRQLLTSTPEAKERMESQIARVWEDFGGVLTFGPLGTEMKEYELISGEKELIDRWLKIINDSFQQAGVELPTTLPQMESGNGREGIHTEDLTTALNTLGEVYNMDRAATW